MAPSKQQIKRTGAAMKKAAPEAFGYLESNLKEAIDQLHNYDTPEDCYWAYFDNAFDGAPAEYRPKATEWEYAMEYFALRWLDMGGPEVAYVHTYPE
jgi:hypothetical protein